MKGYRTIIFALLTAMLGYLQSAGFNDVLVQYHLDGNGQLTEIISAIVLALRLVTSTPVMMNVHPAAQTQDQSQQNKAP